MHHAVHSLSGPGPATLSSAAEESYPPPARHMSKPAVESGNEVDLLATELGKLNVKGPVAPLALPGPSECFLSNLEKKEAAVKHNGLAEMFAESCSISDKDGDDAKVANGRVWCLMGLVYSIKPQTVADWETLAAQLKERFGDDATDVPAVREQFCRARQAGLTAQYAKSIRGAASKAAASAKPGDEQQHWSKERDGYLLQLVEDVQPHDIGSWKTVASMLQNHHPTVDAM